MECWYNIGFCCKCCLAGLVFPVPCTGAREATHRFQSRTLIPLWTALLTWSFGPAAAVFLVKCKGVCSVSLGSSITGFVAGREGFIANTWPEKLWRELIYWKCFISGPFGLWSLCASETAFFRNTKILEAALRGKTWTGFLFGCVLFCFVLKKTLQV